MKHEASHHGYTLSDDPTRLDPGAIHAFLNRSYWSEGISLETVERALHHSLCIGIYATDRAQAGLVRVVSDFTTFAYLCDVYVLESHRGHGLARAAMQFTLAHPKLQNLRRWHLVTRDAHGLYEPFGFSVVGQPERHMEKRDPDIYRRLAETVQEDE